MTLFVDDPQKCPFCGSTDVYGVSLYDEEGIEGWRCGDCEAATTGDWDEPLPPKSEWDWPK